MSCKHLEVGEFGAYSVRVDGKVQIITLQRCNSCKKFLTLDSEEVQAESIIEPIKAAKQNMRTMTMQINSDLYEKLQDLISKETDSLDKSRIMSEIVGLGLIQYKRTHLG